MMMLSARRNDWTHAAVVLPLGVPGNRSDEVATSRCKGPVVYLGTGSKAQEPEEYGAPAEVRLSGRVAPIRLAVPILFGPYDDPQAIGGSVKAGETTVLRLLQGSKVFLIPNFQRRYAWRRPQWEELWDDLIREYESEHDRYSQDLEGHFLGSVVLHPAPGPASTLMRHLVIDGQQRLTTILVLLAALRDVRISQEPEWNPASYDAKYLTNPFDDDYPDRLVPTEFDRVPYIETIRHGRPTGGIGQAYTYFRHQIEEANKKPDFDLSRLGDVLLIHMILVEINTSSGDSVNNIFNTLNSKGLPLSATDLIRNELLLNLDEEEATRVHDEYWLKMEEALVKVDSRGNTSDARFVTFFWAREVCENPATTKKSLFQSFERRLRKRLDQVPARSRQGLVTRLFEEIYRDYELFRLILDPHTQEPGSSDVDPAVRDELASLSSWGSEPYLPIALWLLREYSHGRVEAHEAAGCLGDLLGYLVRRSMLGLPTNNLNRMLSPIPTALANRPKGSSARSELREILSRAAYRWPSDAEVLAGVESQPLYLSTRRAQTRYLLEAAERALAKREFVETRGLTIEHILPQSVPDHWAEYLEENGDSLETAEAVLHTLGNLTLTAYNSELSNLSFVQKRDLLKDSPLRLNAPLASVDRWTVDEVRSRSRTLAAVLVARFPGPARSSGLALASTRLEDLREDITLALQTLPDGAWTVDAELVKLLGADSATVRSLVRELGPEIARIVRADDGSVPTWLGPGLVDEVREQLLEGQEHASQKQKLNAAEIAQLVLDSASVSTSEDPVGTAEGP